MDSSLKARVPTAHLVVEKDARREAMSYTEAKDLYNEFLHQAAEQEKIPDRPQGGSVRSSLPRSPLAVQRLNLRLAKETLAQIPPTTPISSVKQALAGSPRLLQSFVIGHVEKRHALASTWL